MTQQHWGRMTIDAFATKENKRLAKFWSFQPDPDAQATDAFHCTLSKYPVVCVGPSTSSFTPSKDTKIFLHEKSVETEDKLFNDKGCSQLYPHDILNQCK
ncbi:hypothetical protein RMCBS344292_10405 [Rhizopus microsporus]|nr:hypothetical protein RMCBS344292_10405 [Rhizopus microsporus]